MTFKYIGDAVVKERFRSFFDDYSKEAYALYKHYAQEIEKYFDKVQGSVPEEERGRYWTNHTFEAAKGFFARVYQVPGVQVGINIGNTTWYSYNLENDFGGRFASFPDIIDSFAPQINDEVETIPGRIM